MMTRIVATVILATLAARCVADDRRDLFTADNPQPKTLPTLGMWEERSHRKNQTDRFVSATFPNVPDFTCDLWCYESEGVDFESGRPLESGGVEMRHRWAGHDREIVTTATPLPGGLDVSARLEPSGDRPTSPPRRYPGP